MGTFQRLTPGTSRPHKELPPARSGSMYKPSTSTSFSSKRGSLDNLNVSVLQGCSPSGLPNTGHGVLSHPMPGRHRPGRPMRRPIRRSGTQRVRNYLFHHLFPITGGRPLPGRISPTPSTPSSKNRFRQARTVSAFTPTCRAVSAFAAPSTANNRALACRTFRYGNDSDLAIRSNAARCSTDISNGGATNTGTPPTLNTPTTTPTDH